MNHTIRNMTLAERMYSYSQSQQISAQAGCIGYLRADMGSSGWGFYSTWNDRMPSLKTQEFKDELDLVINSFRFSEGTDAFLTNRTALTRYC